MPGLEAGGRGDDDASSLGSCYHGSISSPLAIFLASSPYNNMSSLISVCCSMPFPHHVYYHYTITFHHHPTPATLLFITLFIDPIATFCPPGITFGACCCCLLPGSCWHSMYVERQGCLFFIACLPCCLPKHMLPAGL